MSALPILSFLASVASQYPTFSSPQQPVSPPASAPSVAVPAPAAPIPASAAPTPSAPVNITNASSSHTNPPLQMSSTSPPVNTSSTLCDSCHLRPKYFDGTKTHPFCGKACANKIKSKSNGSSGGSAGNCDFCHVRPKWHDGIRTHPFCSKACAKHMTTPQRKGSHATGSGTNATNTCQAPGCQKPAHTNADGTVGEYCSLAHKTLGETICLMCRQAPKQTKSHFCSKACTDQAEKAGPMILEVPAGHVTFKSVADQFKASWRHSGSSCPPVKRVYKIMAPQASLANFEAYRAAVEARGQFVAAGRSAGNENRRWHGTHRECNLGDKGHTQFCSSTTCSLCSIIRTSFDLNQFGKKTKWGRFGRGIYTSSTASKSNDYSHNDCHSNLKAMLLNKVIVGKGYKMLQDCTTLTAPPPGYDSVLAERGGSLNYDELVVYTNDAIRPSFLVMYEP